MKNTFLRTDWQRSEEAKGVDELDNTSPDQLK